MTYQEANTLVDDFSFIYKGESISKEALIECRELIHTALEKQMPEKPIEKEVIGVSMAGYKYRGRCSRCASTVLQYRDNYCPNCGQALDWSNEDNETN